MSARLSLPRLAVCSLSLFVSACGGGGSSSSGNNGGGDDGPSETVEFAIASQTIVEDNVTVEAVVTLSTPKSHDVEVHFSRSGDAKNLVDFFIPTASPLIIPELMTSAAIEVNIFADDIGELDETITLTIVAVIGAKKGPNNVHTITILDDDEAGFQEMEPNDSLLEANPVGDMEKGKAFLITGNVSPLLSGDEVDIFVFNVLEDVDIDLELDPSSLDSKMTLVLTDATGTPLATFSAAQPGATVKGLFSASVGTLLYFHVTTDLQTDYFLDAVGLQFIASGEDGPTEDVFEDR